MPRRSTPSWGRSSAPSGRRRSSSAGKTSATVHSTWTSGVIAFSPFVQPLSQAGLTADECQALETAVQGLQDAAMSATRRKRRVEWVVGLTVPGVAVGFVLDVIVRALTRRGRQQRLSGSSSPTRGRPGRAGVKSPTRFRTTLSGADNCYMKRLWQRLVPDGGWDRFVRWVMWDHGVTHHERPDAKPGSSEHTPSWEPPPRGRL
jgi:hypothetical protein